MFSLYNLINSANTIPKEEKKIELQNEGTIKKICISCEKEFWVTFFNFSKTPSVIEDRACVTCNQNKYKMIKGIEKDGEITVIQG